MPVFHTHLTPDLVARYTRSGHWGTETFYQILHQQAAAHPDREAIIDHRQRVTYGEFRPRVDRTAAALQHLGCKLHQEMALIGTMRWHWPVTRTARSMSSSQRRLARSLTSAVGPTR